nr:disintegrin and metalloproteinase domain-containing protein 9-like [Chrysemys picta bellii]
MPYTSRSVPMDMPANKFTVPPYAVNHNQPAYHQPYNYPQPHQEQQQYKIPTRPPPPQQKNVPQGHYFPSRPAPLPPM